MFSSYLKLALKVLRRNPFFTSISLFGISFTLMILMVLTAFLDVELGDHAPLSERDRMIFINQISATLWVPDTTYVVDSQLVSGIMQYDTSYQINDARRTSTSNSDGAFRMFDQYLRNLPGSEAITIYNSGANFSIFSNGKKLDYGGIYVDADYWRVMDFSLLEGSFFTQQEIDNQVPVVIMTQEAAQMYFGSSASYLQREITLDRRTYRVGGIVEKPNSSENPVSADVYVPYTHMPTYEIEGDPLEIHGAFQAVILAENTAALPAIQAEIAKIGREFVMPDPDNYNRMEYIATDFMGNYADNLLDMDTIAESKFYFGWGVFVMLALFILLPILNLININISRIMERSAEIGVRKAFGANANTILLQFIFENIILTLIGGFIGWILAILVIFIINDSGLLEDIELRFHYLTFIYSLLICIVFGVLSGAIPAYRISKLNIVESLKRAV